MSGVPEEQSRNSPGIVLPDLRLEGSANLSVIDSGRLTAPQSLGIVEVRSQVQINRSAGRADAAERQRDRP